MDEELGLHFLWSCARVPSLAQEHCGMQRAVCSSRRIWALLRFCWQGGLCLTGSVLVLQPTFLVELSKVLANPGNTQVARVAAGLQVKNSLTSKDPDIKTQHQQRWLAIDANARREIKNYVSADL